MLVANLNGSKVKSTECKIDTSTRKETFTLSQILFLIIHCSWLVLHSSFRCHFVGERDLRHNAQRVCRAERSLMSPFARTKRAA